MNRLIKSLLGGALVVLAFPALAHHSFYAEFDSTQPVRIEGEVEKMEFVNPHSWLHIKVINDQGEEEIWKVEGGSPGVMLRNGWSRDSLPPGTKVIVEGFQAKDGALRMSSRGIQFPDGTVLETGGTSQDGPPRR